MFFLKLGTILTSLFKLEVRMQIRKGLGLIILTGMTLGLLADSLLAEEPVNPVRDRRSYGVKVAVLDSGSNYIYKEGISLIDNTVKDDNGHGTLVSRIIKEVYPKAELYIVKIMNKDGLAINEEAVILGLEWAISKNVDVINMSLRLKDSEKIHQAIKKAYEKGIVILAAAGNRETNVSTYQSKCIKETMVCENVPHDAIRTTQYDIAYPAKYEEVISVGALDRYGKIYAWSRGKEEAEILCKGYKGKKAGTSIACAYATGFAAKVISNIVNEGEREEIRRIIKTKIERGELK